MKLTTERRTALALAGATFALAAPLAYMAQRLFEVARSTPVDPVLVLRDAHTGYYWRVATASWWAGLLACVVYGLVMREGDGERPRRTLTWLVLPVAAVIGLLAWYFP